jgi:hypothetical protein
MRHGAVHTLSLVGVILAPKSGVRFRLLYWLVAADSSGFDLLMMSPRQRMIIHEVHSPTLLTPPISPHLLVVVTTLAP